MELGFRQNEVNPRSLCSVLICPPLLDNGKEVILCAKFVRI